MKAKSQTHGIDAVTIALPVQLTRWASEYLVGVTARVSNPDAASVIRFHTESVRMVSEMLASPKVTKEMVQIASRTLMHSVLTIDETLKKDVQDGLLDLVFALTSEPLQMVIKQLDRLADGGKQ